MAIKGIGIASLALTVAYTLASWTLTAGASQTLDEAEKMIDKLLVGKNNAALGNIRDVEYRLATKEPTFAIIEAHNNKLFSVDYKQLIPDHSTPRVLAPSVTLNDLVRNGTADYVPEGDSAAKRGMGYISTRPKIPPFRESKEGIVTITSLLSEKGARALLGRAVVDADGEFLGLVEDVTLDPQSGEAKQVVISAGGFLGLGEKQFALDLQNLQLQPNQEQLSATNLTEAEAMNLPEFTYGDDSVSLTRNPSAVGTRPSGTDGTGLNSGFESGPQQSVAPAR